MRTFRWTAAVFHQAKRSAIVGLTLSLLMWLVAFLGSAESGF
jgi:predicted small integral membrane protein